MNQQAKSAGNTPAETAISSSPADVSGGLGATPASNDANVADERIRALEALARCMLDAGLGS